ncbi:MAG TPA: NUDIX domain-containing protein, partial [Longimicrobiaceae bacterium]
MRAGATPPVFGAPPAGVAPRERRAAYAVVAGADGRVAAVRGRAGRYWLPGGGSRDGETPEATVLREIREELGREACVGDRIATAVQHFHAADDGCWYAMTAVFLRAGLVGGASG